MSYNHWEDSLEEMCSSPEEAAALKEKASLIERLPNTHYALSFQTELKEKLLSRAALKEKKQWQLKRSLYAKLTAVINMPLQHSRSLGFAAAVLLIFFMGMVLNNSGTGPDKPEASGLEYGKGPLISKADDYLPQNGDAPLVSASDDEKRETEIEKPSQGDEAGVTVEGDLDNSEEEGKAAPDSLTRPPDTTVSSSGQNDSKQDDAVTLPNEPEFEVNKNRRTFTVAGNIILNYGPAADELHPVDNAKYNWEPNKIVLAAENGHSFGTTGWARQLLTDEGFRVRDGDLLKVNVQETLQGLYAEIFYKELPALVLHVHQDKGILSYYYEEKGAAAPHGYYPLLAPAKALNQQLKLESPVEGQQVHFSFRTVRFTYYDFMVEKNGLKETVRLPAYCYTGGELHQGKENVNFYVPAVKF